ncbi:MAG: OB-fold nucleic acid binding domain-containing protein, partial [Candidatus Neomarinimicrobiota bacterium]
FYPVDNNTISFGLNAIKNVGIKALAKIIKAREKDEPFKDIFDVCSRVDLRVLNKKVLESLIMSGAFDSLEGSRAQNLMAISTAIKYGQQRQNGKNHDQFSIFDSRNSQDGDMVKIPDLPVTADWTTQEALKREKDVLGLYISGHPLLKYVETLEEHSNYDFSETVGMITNGKIQIGGSISELRLHYDRKNNQMAFFNLECLGGQAEIVVFSDTYAKCRDQIENDAIIFVKGKPTDESDFSDLKIIAEQIIPLDDREQYLSRRVNIRLTSEVVNEIDLDELYRVAKQYQGEYSMVFHLVNGPKKQRILAHNIKVSSHRDFLKKLKDVYGKQNIWVE